MTFGLPRLLARLWLHFSRRRRRQFAILAVLMVISAFAEVASLSAILPFLGILTSPDWVFKHRLVADFVRSSGITTSDQLLFWLTVTFGAMALIAGAIRMLVLWASTRLAFATGADLSSEIYRRTLYQPYRVHVARNSSEVISGITAKVSGAVNVLYNSLTLMTSAVLLSAITVALLVINPVVALVSTAIFGVSYGLISWMTHRRLRRNSELIASEQTQVVKALQEGLGGIRDVLLDGTQPVYCEVYRRADQPLRRADGNNNFIGGCPRFAMEALGMLLIAGLAYGLSRRSDGLSVALPTLGALAMGAQRLLPTLQQGYSAWAGIVGNRASVVDAINLLDQPLPSESMQAPPQPLPFKENIAFQDVRFRYGDEGPWVIDGLNLITSKGSRVGIVGTTGSGKSTVLDLLMGLLQPTSGQVLVDGRAIVSSSVRAWQRVIAHVPQSIFLSDATLAQNIAFGVSAERIDLSRVRQAALQAQIAEFIENRSQGYDEVVGEHGIRLSGGQRQRIGIARALYKQASVLVFDEATSALDNVTEQTVMEAIEALNRELTVILIAHRLSTVRNCDTIIELEAGRVVAQGRFEQLLECSPTFRRIAQAAGR
jgi:ATP-binding cassette, subfamily B, bacterial PglK